MITDSVSDTESAITDYLNVMNNTCLAHDLHVNYNLWLLEPYNARFQARF